MIASTSLFGRSQSASLSPSSDLRSSSVSVSVSVSDDDHTASRVGYKDSHNNDTQGDDSADRGAIVENDDEEEEEHEMGSDKITGM
jgi:hypothetical protein